MLFIDEAGEGIEFGGDGSEKLALNLSDLTDTQIEAFLGQLLTRIGFTATRAARILRTSRSRFFELRQVPLPDHLFELFERDAEAVALALSPAPGRGGHRSRRV